MNPRTKTHYEVLGINPTTSSEEIKQTYLNYEFHRAELNQDDIIKDTVIKVATETLMNPIKRKAYDESLFLQAKQQNSFFAANIQMPAVAILTRPPQINEIQNVLLLGSKNSKIEFLKKLRAQNPALYKQTTEDHELLVYGEKGNQFLITNPKGSEQTLTDSYYNLASIILIFDPSKSQLEKYKKHSALERKECDVYAIRYKDEITLKLLSTLESLRFIPDKLKAQEVTPARAFQHSENLFISLRAEMNLRVKPNPADVTSSRIDLEYDPPQSGLKSPGCCN